MGKEGKAMQHVISLPLRERLMIGQLTRAQVAHISVAGTRCKSASEHRLAKLGDVSRLVIDG